MPGMEDSTLTIVVGVVMVISFFCFTIWASTRYKRVGPDQALIVYGQRGTKVVTGGGTFVWPYVMEAKSLDLRPHLIEVTATESPDGEDVSATITGQVRIPSEEAWVTRAATSLIDKTPEEIQALAGEMVEGKLRTTLRATGKDAAVQNPDQVAASVQQTVEDELAQLGLQLLSCNAREVAAR